MHARGLMLIAVMILCFAGCGGSVPDTGSITFSVAWDTGSAQSKVLMAPPPGADVCKYYQIDTINVNVTTASGQYLTSGSWPCSAHGGTLSNVPAGIVNVIVEAVVGVTTAWRGQASGITVASGQTANAGTVKIYYIGNDVSRPWVQSTTPSADATGIALNASVSAVFSEDIVSASVNTTSFTLTCNAAAVPGAVAYVSLSSTATFTPTSSLSEAVSCTALITTGVEDLAGHQMSSNHQWSFTSIDLTAPAIVTGVTASAASSSQIDLLWTPSTDNVAVTGYKIYRDGSLVTTVTATTYPDTGLAALTQYCYAVSAIDAANNESSHITQVCATTNDTPIVPPTAPSGLTATAASATSITLGWMDNSNNETTFRIERSSASASSGFVEIGTTAANAVSFSSTGLSSSTTYWYRVRAYNTAGFSLYTNVASASTPLPAPTGVTATAGNQQNTIAWSTVAGAISYNIYWSTASGVNRTYIASRFSSGTNSLNHSGLTNWVTYYYVVTAINAQGIESYESQEVSAVPRGAAGALDITFNSQGWVVYNNASGGNIIDRGNSIAIDSSGRILVAGLSRNVFNNDDMVIWRYNTNGTLDTTFNNPSGFVVHNSAAGGNNNDAGYGIALDSTGRILVTGRSRDSSGDAMVIWRYNSNGTLDTTFNKPSGFVVHNNAAGGGGYDRGYGIAIDSIGRILVTGESWSPTGNANMAIWRYNTNGTLDTTFNNPSGFVVHNSAAGGNNNDAGYGIALDSTGRILVAGYSANAAGNDDVVIWRYNTNGTPDTTFNGRGWVVNNTAGGKGLDRGSGIARDSTGRILAAGYSANAAGGNPDMAIWRYNTNGTPDTTFNGRGWVTNHNAAGGNDYDRGSGIAIDSSGRILVAGYSTGSTGFFDMVIWRYNSTGYLDTTFNGQGIVVHNSAAGGGLDDRGYGIVIDSSGRILVTGDSINTAGNTNMVIWRYNP